MKTARLWLAATLLAVASAFITMAAATADTLHWTLPTERENGAALNPDDITAVTVYRAGEPLAGLPGAATSYDVPSCHADVYTVTATAAGLQSAHSNEARVEIDQVGCRPKAPSGLGLLTSSPGS